MITAIRNGKVILDNEIKETTVYIEDGKITSVTGGNLPCDNEIDARGRYVSPGFIDIHVHGGGGFEFVDAAEEAVVSAANIHALHGTTTIYPTISAFDREKTEKALEALEKYKDEAIPNIYGCHLEGPYFSPAQSGAQDPRFIRNPDAAEYADIYNKYGNLIKRWSYAPELPGSVKFQRFLNKKGIVGAAGHTDAVYDDVMAVYGEGMKLITHLYSCTSTITREQGFRRLGVIESAYLTDDIDVETIADGCHLPPELLKLIYKIKGGEHMCLVTDSIRHGGMTDVENVTCENGNIPYIIEDGVAKLADRSAFAGSIATADVLVRTCVKKAGIPLAAAVGMMTAVPARIMKLDTTGEIKPGFDADIVIFDDDINVEYTIVKGKVVCKNA